MEEEWDETSESQKQDLPDHRAFCRHHVECIACSPPSTGHLHRNLNFDTLGKSPV